MDGLALLALYFAIGAAAARTGFLRGEEFHALARLVFYVCLPASILLNAPDQSSVQGIAAIALLTALPLLAVGALVFLLYRLERIPGGSFGAVLVSSTFGNVVYLGVPVSQAYFPGTVGEMSVAIIVTNLAVFCFALPLIDAAGGRKTGIAKSVARMASNPVLLSAIAAFLMLALGIGSAPLAPVLSPLAGMTVPLSLIAMGMFVARDFRLSLDRDVATILALKHLALPAATFACLLFIRPGAELSGLVLLSSFMSPAIANFSIVDSLGLGREKEVSSAIILGILVMFAEAWLVFGAG
jgi:predicted permease